MKKSSKKTITRDEYLQLLGLKMLGNLASGHIEEYVKAARAIVAEESDWGHMADMMYDSDLTVDEQLKKLDIKILVRGKK